MSLRSEARIYLAIMAICFLYFLVIVCITLARPDCTNLLLSADQTLDGAVQLANSLVAGIFASSLLAFLLTSVSYSVERARRALSVADGLQRIYYASRNARVEELPGELSAALGAELDFSSLLYFDIAVGKSRDVYSDSQRTVEAARNLCSSAIFHVKTYRTIVVEMGEDVSAAHSRPGDIGQKVRKAKNALDAAASDLGRLQNESSALQGLSDDIRECVRRSGRLVLVRRLLEREIRHREPGK